INDKSEGDTHVKQLVDPSLKVTVAANGPATLGNLLDGTAVTNDMLSQAFAITDAAAAPGDPVFRTFAAEQDLDPIHNPRAAKWNANPSTAMGAAGALAIRLLQMKSPIVCIKVGATFDSHSSEVVDPQTSHAHPVQALMLTRLLSGLAFTLQSI